MEDAAAASETAGGAAASSASLMVTAEPYEAAAPTTPEEEEDNDEVEVPDCPRFSMPKMPENAFPMRAPAAAVGVREPAAAASPLRVRVPRLDARGASVSGRGRWAPPAGGEGGAATDATRAAGFACACSCAFSTRRGQCELAPPLGAMMAAVEPVADETTGDVAAPPSDALAGDAAPPPVGEVSPPPKSVVPPRLLRVLRVRVEDTLKEYSPDSADELLLLPPPLPMLVTLLPRLPPTEGTRVTNSSTSSGWGDLTELPNVGDGGMLTRKEGSAGWSGHEGRRSGRVFHTE